MLNKLDAAEEIDLYYLDETGFCLIPCVPYGWQPVGETIAISSKRSKRLNVLGIMNRHDQLHSYILCQGITSEAAIPNSKSSR